ncbi:hypothetical protein B0H17DRAFT_1027189, partial [Mycena rosella]
SLAHLCRVRRRIGNSPSPRVRLGIKKRYHKLSERARYKSSTTKIPTHREARA